MSNCLGKKESARTLCKNMILDSDNRDLFFFVLFFSSSPGMGEFATFAHPLSTKGVWE